MNSIERVMGTIQGQPVDRVPVGAVLSSYGARLLDLDLRVVFNDAKTYIESQKAVHEKFAVDFALAPFDYSVIAEGFGSSIRFFKDQAPNIKKPSTINWREVIEKPFPDFNLTGRFPVFLEALKGMIELFAGKKPVFAGIPGPCSMPIMIMGLEAWLETLLFDPEGAQKVMDYCGEFFEIWAARIMQEGTTGLIVTEGMAAREITDRENFECLVLPHLKKYLSRVNAPMVFHHTGGSINHILDLTKDIPGILGFCVSAEDDLLAARRIIGPEKLLLGNIDNLCFPASGSEQIYEQSQKILKLMHQKGPFILSNSGGDLPLNTPETNITAMIEASEGKK